MRLSWKKIVVPLLLLFFTEIKGQALANSMIVDTIPVDTSRVEKPVKKSLIKKLITYLSLDGDQESKKSNKPSISLLGGPFYNTDSKFGVAVMGVSTFRLKGCDTTEQFSNAQLSFSLSTAKFWSLVFKGNLFTPREAVRVNYWADLSYEPSYFWGIGYDNGHNDQNKTMQHKHYLIAKVEGLFRVARGLHMGPTVLFNFNRSDNIARPWLLEGQALTTYNYGVGAVLEYDSRDLITDAHKGVYFHLGQLFRPKFLWNRYAFSTTEFQACYYHPVWKGGIVASEVMGQFNYGNPSWGMMAQVGDSYHMRGYYRGRYRDKHMLNFQVELRQHLWHRHGITLWLGGGTAFHNQSTFKHFLPNWGIGYRFAFRRRMNVRLDIGWAKGGESGIIFGINEAF
jgi:hypothetical protein